MIPVNSDKFLRVRPNVVRTEKSGLELWIVGESNIEHVVHIGTSATAWYSALCGPGDQTDHLHERRRHQGLASQKTQEVWGPCQAPHSLSATGSGTRRTASRVEWRTYELFHSRHHQPSGNRFINTVHRRGLPLAVEMVSFERDERKEGSSLLTSPEPTTTTRGI